MKTWMALSLLGGVALAGCSSTLVESDYDRACTSELECVTARFGDLCAPCGCSDGAIASSSAERYRSDAEWAKRSCAPSDLQARCKPCQDSAPRCIERRCVGVPQTASDLPLLDGGVGTDGGGR